MPDQEQPVAETVEYDIVIDGEKLSEDWADDLSFREQRDFRKACRDLIGDPQADVDIEHGALVDWLPALAYIVRKRKNAEYTLEQVLDEKPSDFLVRVDKAEADKVPPTSGVAKRKR